MYADSSHSMNLNDRIERLTEALVDERRYDHLNLNDRIESGTLLALSASSTSPVNLNDRIERL